MIGVWLLAIGLAAAGPAPVDFTGALANAARLEQSGDLAGAIAAYRSLLRLAERNDGVRSGILESLALVETTAGEYSSATRHAEAAAAIHAAIRDDRRQARALNSAGLASLYAGLYDSAARALTRAIELSTSAHDDEGRTEQMMNLANVFFFLGRYSDASQLYGAALDIARGHGAETWAARRIHLLQVNRATLDQRLGRDDEALAVYRQLETESAKLRPREQAQIVVNQGVLYRHLGDPIKALAAYDRALDLFSRDRHVDGELGVMKNRGIVFALDFEDFDAARRCFSDALSRAQAAGNGREVLQAQLYRAESQLRAGLLAAARADFEASLQAADALHTPEETWKALYGIGRIELARGATHAAALSLERAIGVIERVRESIRVPNLKSDFFNDKRDVYDALIGIEIERAAPARVFTLIERGHSRAWRDRLGLTGTVDLDIIQRALPAGVALLDFWNSSAGSAVAVVTRSSATIERLLIDPATIDRLVGTLAGGPSSTWRRDATSLAESLLPGKLPPDIRHVIVVPDGALALVPFELLPVGSQLLVEQVAVSYMPTAAMLLRPVPRDSPVRPPWRLQLSAFADPISARSDLDTTESVRGRLIASRDEVHAIASEITGATALHLTADNRKAHLYDERARAPILHLATHAVADSNAVERSRILFSPASGTGDQADYLFLKEAYDLNLKGVELAVLSACDTERGRVLRGEGVQSFSRAFLAAGARSTVTTLWRIPDASTAAFMTVFYYYLRRGVPRAEALRLAKLRFLHGDSALNDPHVWAAFVLTGDGMRPITWPIAWTTFGITSLAAIVIALGGWRSIVRWRAVRRRKGSPPRH